MDNFRLILDIIKTTWPIGAALSMALVVVSTYYIKTSVIEPISRLNEKIDSHIKDVKEKEKEREEEKRRFLNNFEENFKAIENDLAALWRYKADNQNIEAKLKDIETRLFEIMLKISTYFSGGKDK
jgi:hypothetical protein